MTTQAVTAVDDNGGHLTYMSAIMANGDVSAPFAPPKGFGGTFQVKGTFGSAGSMQLEGSLDGGTTWSLLKDYNGTSTAQTSAAAVAIAAIPALLRFHATAGDGSTALVGMFSLARSN